MQIVPSFPTAAHGAVADPIPAAGAAATSVTAMQTMLAAALLALWPQAQAQPASQDPAYGFSGRIGLGVSSVPTYEGSPNRRTLAVADLTLSYRSRQWGSVEFGPRGLTWNAVESGLFRFAVVAQFDPGRKDKDTPSTNSTPGDKRLAGMGLVTSSTEAGVGIGYGPLMVVARQALSSGGRKGRQVDMTVDVPWSVSDRLAFHLGVGATWADQDYLQTYFGVTPAQARVTSFAVYTPKSGCRKVEASLGAEYTWAANWRLQGTLGYARLEGDAAASSLVARRSSTTAALAVGYVF